MGSLIYSAISSLDGYIEDANGNFQWAAPDAEVHAFVNELERPIGTYLYGRGMYATMSYWETAVDHSPVSQAYADIWRAADKIVYSRTLTSVETARTRLEHEFTPAAVADLKQSSPTALSIGGADLGGQALKAGLVDEVHLLLAPVLVGGGKRSLPDGLTTQLTLLDQHTFASGFIHLHYTVGD
ncbi:dihydrofolate reductase family protein [Kribbella sp. NPDC048928]|uniref:dihydrofolate reductase family protein n=1 Tax=Kribbella sp. NPDC048928 TaxID=3364111 RepID=UPI0037236D3A